MEAGIGRVVHATSATAAAIGALLSSFPLVDELLLAPLYGLMALRIGRLHALELAAIPWRPIGRTTFNGLLARAGLNIAVAFIPGVAAAANALSAAALSEWLGRYVDACCDAPAEASSISIIEILADLRARVSPPSREAAVPAPSV